MSWTTTAEALCELVRNRDSGSENELNDDWGGLQGIADAIRSDLKDGLSIQVSILFICTSFNFPKEIETGFGARKEHFGTNVLPQEPPRPFWSFYWDAIQDETLVILMIAAVVSIILGEAFPSEDAPRS
jgi:hypothetical protein